MASSAPDHLRTPGLISNRPCYEGINILPKNGCVNPLTKAPKAAARDMVPRLQPNSSLIGMTNTPKELRAPVVSMAMKKKVPTRYQPGELFPRVGFIVTNLSYPVKGIVNFYNGRGTAEQWIKEGKYALNWTRLSCHKFVANQVRLWLFILAYNLGNFLRRLALPESIKRWSLTSVQTRLIKIGGRLVRHARRLVFQLAEVMVTRTMFDEMLDRIGRLRFNPG